MFLLRARGRTVEKFMMHTFVVLSQRWNMGFKADHEVGVHSQ